MVTTYCASGFGLLGRRALADGLWGWGIGRARINHKPQQCFGVVVLLNLVWFVIHEMRAYALVLPKQFNAPGRLPDVVHAVQCTYMSYGRCIPLCFPAFVISDASSRAHASTL